MFTSLLVQVNSHNKELKVLFLTFFLFLNTSNGDVFEAIEATFKDSHGKLTSLGHGDPS